MREERAVRLGFGAIAMVAIQKLSFSSSFFSHVTAVSLKELQKNKLIIILFELYYFLIYINAFSSVKACPFQPKSFAFGKLANKCTNWDTKTISKNCTYFLI